MRLKKGVTLQGIRPEMVAVVSAVDAWNASTVCTSICDGKHSRASLHYVGQAMDFRTRDLDEPANFANHMREFLNEEFDVVLESTHLHVEYQPKR